MGVNPILSFYFKKTKGTTQETREFSIEIVGNFGLIITNYA